MPLKIQLSQHMARIFKALSDPHRLQILYMLKGREFSVNSIAQSFPEITRAAISQHLQVLKKARLVKHRNDKTLHLYSLDTQPLKTVQNLISKLDKNDPWPEKGQGNIFENK